MRFRIPRVMGAAYQALEQVEQTLRQEDTLAHEIRELAKIRASQINRCAVCLDVHIREILSIGVRPEKIFQLEVWRESPYFDERERAALELTEAVTRMGEDGVPDDVWAVAEKQFSEVELGNLVMTISLINAFNRVSVTAKAQPRVRQYF
ncbi:alkyl hydroperoxide reductase AhpD [Actinorhabdospora filicis]|uniref:Alkyl hydroperoxide reductase AhpD n=1 Tax=Actinorhabdospora filicis TaxID=1785913 RepID=A0A9W6SSE7_9ACTN|nr:carboxymuconolactone decarboxylase family protein [Actinorhabdospora filicis]GLZ81223.1 alkyl hydroperoxide reductase AhpD [Actinorhabdospora filicis]